MPRVGFLPAAVLVVAILVWSATAGAAVQRVETPRAADIASGAAIVDTTLSPQAARALALGAFWGGPTVASTGETVNVFFSETYPQDPAVATKWASFIASLVHGPELAELDAYFLPLGEVQRYCGRSALACYSPGQSTLVAPAEDPDGAATAEAVVAHEYGHHVAAHRVNAPWDAVDYGTKRWASYENVCARSAAGELHPGDETEEYYEYNPGEAFAESYRVLNERALGMAETPWEIVTTSLYPDEAALALLRQDVLEPWTTPTSLSYRSSRGRTYTISTSLDGVLRVTIRASAKARYRLSVSAGGRQLASVTTKVGGAKATSTAICGVRSAKVTVNRLTKAGTFTLAVSKP